MRNGLVTRRKARQQRKGSIVQEHTARPPVTAVAVGQGVHLLVLAFRHDHLGAHVPVQDVTKIQ